MQGIFFEKYCISNAWLRYYRNKLSLVIFITQKKITSAKTETVIYF